MNKPNSAASTRIRACPTTGQQEPGDRTARDTSANETAQSGETGAPPYQSLPNTMCAAGVLLWVSVRTTAEKVIVC